MAVAQLADHVSISLSVLRGILADVTNASKTPAPIKTDRQMIKLLQKRVKASKDAASQFAAAGRQDLTGKEESQVAVLEEYASQVAEPAKTSQEAPTSA